MSFSRGKYKSGSQSGVLSFRYRVKACARARAREQDWEKRGGDMWEQEQ
jgi:hypothetical protein